GRILGTPQAREAIADLLEQIFQGPAVAETLTHLSHDRGAMAGLGIFGLLWAAAQIFLNLEMALDLAWRAPIGRHFLLSRALAFSMTFGAGVLVLAATLTTLLLDGLHEIARQWLPEARFGWLWTGAHQAVPFLVTLAALEGLYQFLPNTRVRPQAALAGAL